MACCQKTIMQFLLGANSIPRMLSGEDTPLTDFNKKTVNFSFI